MNKKKGLSEADVKRLYITPALHKSGWEKNITMEYYFTDGRVGLNRKRGERKFADYLLFYKSNLPLAIVEAKDDSHVVGAGMQQAIEYGEALDIPFIYTSNGSSFVEHDRFTGKEKIIPMDNFPTKEELWERFIKANNVDEVGEKLIVEPYYYKKGDKTPRYYQRIAINRTIEAIAKGQNRILLVMATGTGKTYTAFQIIYRLWKQGIKKKILFLADRNILVDQTMIQDFKPFSKVMTKIEGKKLDSSYEVYLGLYQQLAGEENEEPFREFQPNFFDLIVIDECHRGSAKEDSRWRKILEYFKDATQIGMTATPKETKDVSNISYFGEPIYTYSLDQGIKDGFLAPYRVIKSNLSIDIEGYRPQSGELDARGNLIPDKEYTTRDFDKTIIIDARTQAVAKRVSDYLKETDRYSKTIIFCVDIEHAERMRRALINENMDLIKKDPRYVMRITGDDKEGKAQLDNFIDVNSEYPVIVTTSKLLTTGVDCKTCKLIVLDRNIQSMTEFKQIIGRGTRLYPDKDKLFFTIMDFKKATDLFYDPDFDGEPEVIIDDTREPEDGDKTDGNKPDGENTGGDNIPTKYYIDGIKEVSIVLESESYLDSDGKLIVGKVIDYTKRNILGEYATLDSFLNVWNKSHQKKKIIEELEKKDVNLDKIRDLLQIKDSIDDFDLICHVAYNLKPMTRSERVRRVKLSKLYDQYSDECKKVLDALLDKYNENGIADLEDITILKNDPFKKYGNAMNIARLFGGKEGYLNMVHEVTSIIYGA